MDPPRAVSNSPSLWRTAGVEAVYEKHLALLNSTVAIKFSVGAHARTALKYWFKGTVTAMRMRRGEAL